MASWHSSGVRNLERVVYGVSGRRKKVAMPTGIVMHYALVRMYNAHRRLPQTYAAHYVQPSPTDEPMCSIEVLIYCRLKIATKCGSKGCGHVE